MIRIKAQTMRLASLQVRQFPGEIFAITLIVSIEIGTLSPQVKDREVVAHLGVEHLSTSTVSRIPRELDERVAEFFKRPIEQPIQFICLYPNLIGAMTCLFTSIICTWNMQSFLRLVESIYL